MKRCLYIGIFSNGSTSKMRAERIRHILHDWDVSVIDTDIPFFKQHRILRSLAFRFQIGPGVSAINRYVLDHVVASHYDLVWVDKGIYFTEETMSVLKKVAGKLVHYTPDTAFYKNRSAHFFKTIDRYDLLMTTKQFELPDYYALVAPEKVLLVTQGFDRLIHKPAFAFAQKTDRVAFVGLAEPAREHILQYLLDNGIRIALAGVNWDRFVGRNKNNPLLDYKGTSLWNQAYVDLISSSLFSLGLLSKRFPELHTTRTFEIPACGTALLTEYNEETSIFFAEDEAVFYKDAHELLQKINYYRGELPLLEQVTINGMKKVSDAGFEYTDILGKALQTILNQ